MSVDLIIYSYKPGDTFLKLLDSISEQSISVDKIIIMNVEQKFFDRLMYSYKISDKHKNLEIHHIARREADIGKWRNTGVRYSTADYFLMMDSDTFIETPDAIEKLLKPFSRDEKVAVSYARKTAPENAPEYVKYALKYRFPLDSSTRSEKDLSTLKSDTYQSSNSCALYKRSTFDELGGFLNHVIANEDVIYASKAINAGYKVAYVSEAVACTNRTFTVDEEKERYFDIAVSFSKHPEVFDMDDVKERLKKTDKLTLDHLKRNGYTKEFIEFKRIEHARRAGFQKGTKFKKIASFDVAKYSYNKDYWRMDEILRDRTAVDVHSGYGRSASELEMLSTPPVMKKKEEN